MRVGIAHHLGWAVAVTADDDHRVVDRRRLELVGEGLPVAPVHHEGGAWQLHRDGPPLNHADLAALVAEVRASVVATTAEALGRLAADLPGPVRSISLRAWSRDLPTDIAVLRTPPYESRADSVMYLEVLADDAARRGWDLHTFDAARVEARARDLLGARADDVLVGPRARLGPPWAKDHRLALAATVLAAQPPSTVSPD